MIAFVIQNCEVLKVCLFRHLHLLLLGTLEDHIHVNFYVLRVRKGQGPRQIMGIMDYLYLFILESLASSKRMYSFRAWTSSFSTEIRLAIYPSRGEKKESELDRWLPSLLHWDKSSNVSRSPELQETILSGPLGSGA